MSNQQRTVALTAATRPQSPSFQICHKLLKPFGLSSTSRCVPAALGLEPGGFTFLWNLEQDNPLPAGSSFLLNAIWL
jgi:hypothetical protein